MNSPTSSLQDKIKLFHIETSITPIENITIQTVIIPMIDQILFDVNIFEESEYLEGIHSILIFITKLYQSKQINSEKTKLWLDKIIDINNVLGKKSVGEYDIIVDDGLDKPENFGMSILKSDQAELSDVNTRIIESLISLIMVNDLCK